MNTKQENLENIITQLGRIYWYDIQNNVAHSFFVMDKVNGFFEWVRGIIEKIDILPECYTDDGTLCSGYNEAYGQCNKYYIGLKYSKFKFGQSIGYLMIYFYGGCGENDEGNDENYVCYEEKLIDKKNNINSGKRRILHWNSEEKLIKVMNEIIREWMEE